MAPFLQLHLLTVYPPSNLNRDDTGRPKTAVIGGDTRLRVSSQSLKRAWRNSTVFKDRLEGRLGVRTQRIGDQIEKHLKSKSVKDDQARVIAREIAAAFGKLKPEQDKTPTYTEQLAFISPEEQDAAFALAEQRAFGGRAAPKGDAKDSAKETAKLLLRAKDTAADIAMFGRMLADNPDFNREAAVQVAHAFTTHRVTIEDDYYTAVDDLKRPSEDAGAGFLGEAGFGSGVFYLYACVDRGLLIDNLGGDADLARAAIGALVEAAAKVGPSGKQASFASRAICSYALAEQGSEQPRTLAAAFLRGVDRMKGDEDFLARSVARLQDLRDKFDHSYGRGDVRRYEMDVAKGEATLFGLVDFAQDARHA